MRTLLGYLWLGLLIAALLVAGLSADRRARQIAEYPCCCDPFGYLQMARDVREARANGTTPDFTIETEQTRMLIDLMKSKQVPVQHWEHVVSPLAYHYFSGTDRVGVQYPPGTGFMLSLFPEGRALHGLDRLVVLVFVIGGLALLIVAGMKRAWFAAGFSCLALVVGLDILANIDIASFSVNALLIPLLLSGLCMTAAYALRNRVGKTPYLTLVLIGLAGFFFGFAVLVRLPVLFMLPGILLLLAPAQPRYWFRSALLPFGVGFLVGGVLPLIFYQWQMTGSWYSSTYPRYDTLPPSLEFFWANLKFYFGPGKTQPFNWSLPVTAAGLIGLIIGQRKTSSEVPLGLFPRLTRLRWLIAALVTWTAPLAYLLMHTPSNHYYPLPTTFGTVLLAGLGAFAFDTQRIDLDLSQSRSRKALQIAAVVLSLVPGVAAIEHAWRHNTPPSNAALPVDFEIPAALTDEHAWLWADFHSGTIWYYARKSAFKLGPTTDQTRELIFEFVRSRGEPQYIIGGDPGVEPVMRQLATLGAKLELKGQLDIYPYYLIRWPDDSTAETKN